MAAEEKEVGFQNGGTHGSPVDPLLMAIGGPR
jgi:hypothetical protein